MIFFFKVELKKRKIKIFEKITLKFQIFNLYEHKFVYNVKIRQNLK